MTITQSSNMMQPGFIADARSIDRNGGKQVDFDLLPDSYRAGIVANTIKLNDAGAAIGGTSITVDALPVNILSGALLDFGHISNVAVALSAAAARGATSIAVTALPGPIPAGSLLDFGAWAAVTVTVASSALANATSISVNALSGPIPNGTQLDFGGTKLAILTAAAASGATTLTVRALPTALAGAETATFPAQDKLVRTSADAAAAATSISVDALDVPLAATDTATFVGGTKQVRVTADALAGATTLTVDELEFAIPDDATATYYTHGSGAKVIPAGTVMCQLTNGKLFPRAIRPNAETACSVLETEASEKSPGVMAGFGQIVGGVLYENLLPEADANTGLIDSDFKDELADAGSGFSWQVASNSLWS